MDFCMKTPMKLQIDKALTELLKSKGITLRELSKHTGVPLSSLSEWKKNNRNPNAEHLSTISMFFGCSVHYLLYNQDDPAEPIQKILKSELFQGTFEITLKKVNIKD